MFIMGIGTSSISSRLFDALKSKLESNNNSRLAIIDMEKLNNLDAFKALLNFLEDRYLIEYEISFKLTIIRITEKGAARIRNFDTW